RRTARRMARVRRRARREGRVNRIEVVFRHALLFVELGALLLLPLVASAQTPQATPPPPAPPRSVQFPKPVEQTLANGLRVIVIERSGAPLVTAQLVIKN